MSMLTLKLKNYTEDFDLGFIKGLVKAAHQRIHAFKLWCWRRFLRVPWTARRSSQSVLKEINPKYSLEGLLMLQLKLQYFGHLIRRELVHWKRPWLGKIDGKRIRGRQVWLDSISDSMDMNLSKLQKRENRGAWHAAVHGVAKSGTLLSNQTANNRVDW